MAGDASPGNFASPRILVIAGLAMFAVVAWWAMRDTDAADGQPAATGASAADLSQQEDNSQWPGHGASATEPADEIAIVSANSGNPEADANFATYVSGKYKFLTQSPKLTAALMSRERIAVAINTAKQSVDESLRQQLPRLEAELAEADRKVGESLAAGDVAGYEVLKNSDMDQFQFEDYVGGISNVVPLADDKKQAILYAKLTNRQRFRQVLENSGLMRGDLTPSQRQNAFNDVSRALLQSRDGFLQEARQHMHDEEQFTLLSNYENSEYSGELDKLRRIADGE
jgi:hypothetical protein